MARKLRREEARELNLPTRPKPFGDRQGYRCPWDWRLGLLSLDDGWWVGVTRYFRHPLPLPLKSEDGPYATPAEAMRAARGWHLDHPLGKLAEVLAARDCPPELRNLLHGVNEYGADAMNAVHDLLGETDQNKLIDALIDLGMLPDEYEPPRFALGR
jgi:hypothetical protein